MRENCQHEILEFVKKRNFRIRWMLDPMKSTFYILFWTLRHLKKEWLKKTRQMEDKKKNPRPPRSTMVGISKFWPEIRMGFFTTGKNRTEWSSCCLSSYSHIMDIFSFLSFLGGHRLLILDFFSRPYSLVREYIKVV